MSIFDRLEAGVFTQSAQETIRIAEVLAKALPSESIVTLEGDLGAGKTTFVKGFAKGFCIDALITSPTFNIYNTYRGDRTLIHMDAYRLEAQPKVVDELMLEDFMNPPYCLAIEWPQNLGELPWPATLKLALTITGPGHHHIQSIA